MFVTENFDKIVKIFTVIAMCFCIKKIFHAAGKEDKQAGHETSGDFEAGRQMSEERWLLAYELNNLNNKIGAIWNDASAKAE